MLWRRSTNEGPGSSCKVNVLIITDKQTYRNNRWIQKASGTRNPYPWAPRMCPGWSKLYKVARQTVEAKIKQVRPFGLPGKMTIHPDRKSSKCALIPSQHKITTLHLQARLEALVNRYGSQPQTYLISSSSVKNVTDLFGGTFETYVSRCIHLHTDLHRHCQIISLCICIMVLIVYAHVTGHHAWWKAGLLVTQNTHPCWVALSQHKIPSRRISKALNIEAKKQVQVDIHLLPPLCTVQSVPDIWPRRQRIGNVVIYVRTQQSASLCPSLLADSSLSLGCDETGSIDPCTSMGTLLCCWHKPAVIK